MYKFNLDTTPQFRPRLLCTVFSEDITGHLGIFCITGVCEFAYPQKLHFEIDKIYFNPLPS